MKKFNYKINGKDYEVIVDKHDDLSAEVQVEGNTYKVEFEKKEEEPATPKIQRPVASAPVASAPAGGSAKGEEVKSPLPGIIIDVRVNVGDVVKKGQTVVMLEAMKMENAINAPVDGKIVDIKVNRGDSVLEGVTLLTIG